MSAKPVGQDSRLERALSLEIVRVTERAAVAPASSILPIRRKPASTSILE
jgi:hypothetical protein